MVRKKYEPTKTDLRKAWRIKQNKGTVADICSKLKIGFGQYEHNRHVFNTYFEQQKLILKNKIAARCPGKGVKSRAQSKFSGPNYKSGEHKLTAGDIDTDVLKSYVICGFNRDKIAGLLGIGRTKLHMLAKESQQIDDILNKSVEDTAADVLRNGLMTLAKEHTVPDTHFASYQGDIYSREYRKHFRPHLGAIKYILANTLGWQSEAKPHVPNNKGAILRMMDDIANHEDGVGPVEDDDQREDTLA